VVISAESDPNCQCAFTCDADIAFFVQVASATSVSGRTMAAHFFRLPENLVAAGGFEPPTKGF
jgi:hypothetical protein